MNNVTSRGGVDRPPAESSLEAEFISVEELSRRIGISKQSIYRALDRNEMPGVFKLGRRVTINWSAVVAKSYESS